MEIPNAVRVGDAVQILDTTGHHHMALVTAVWGTFYPGETWTEEEATNHLNSSQYYDDKPEQKAEQIATLIGSAHTIPCINVVYLSGDESKTDSYGRQLERDMTSVQHRSATTAPGRYWF